jgi:hypothetical protein
VKRRNDPKQTLFDWGGPQAPAPAASALPDPIQLAIASPPPSVQRLRWDFVTTFPLPSDDAIHAGVLHETDLHPENLKALHQGHAGKCLAVFKALDTVMDARRHGIDPKTGREPQTHEARERLRKYFSEATTKLEHAFNGLIETYENTFGVEAAVAFAKCIRARYAGIPIEIDSSHQRLATAPSRKRVCVTLPVPKPSPEAIEAGHFGQEDGKPLKPTTAEIRAITERHADKMIDLLDGIRQLERTLGSSQCSDRARVEAETERLNRQVREAIEKYAGSFGKEAAEQLEAYSRRQALLDGTRRQLKYLRPFKMPSQHR